jgi:hypothetical protein
MTQSCSVTASLLTSSPTALSSGGYCSLASSTLTGGQISINGVGTDMSGTYTLTLKNSVAGSIQTANVTVTLVDPCQNAVFQTSPNPFSDVTVVVPGTTTISTLYHVFTDVENSTGIICPNNSTFVSPWSSAVSTSSLNQKHKIDPT